MFDTGSLDGFKGAVNRWLLTRVVFFFRGADACGCERSLLITLFFPLGLVLLVLIIITVIIIIITITIKI